MSSIVNQESLKKVKTPLKRKREEKKESEDPKEVRLEKLKEKAKDAVIPDEKHAVLKPEFIFMDDGPLVLQMCHSCRIFNSKREPLEISDGMVQMPLALCTVCRHHFNHQRSIKFFELDLPSIKKHYKL